MSPAWRANRAARDVTLADARPSAKKIRSHLPRSAVWGGVDVMVEADAGVVSL